MSIYKQNTAYKFNWDVFKSVMLRPARDSGAINFESTPFREVYLLLHKSSGNFEFNLALRDCLELTICDKRYVFLMDSKGRMLYELLFLVKEAGDIINLFNDWYHYESSSEENKRHEVFEYHKFFICRDKTRVVDSITLAIDRINRKFMDCILIEAHPAESLNINERLKRQAIAQICYDKFLTETDNGQTLAMMIKIQEDPGWGNP